MYRMCKTGLCIFTIFLLIMFCAGCSWFQHPCSVLVEGDGGIIVKENTFRVKPGTRWGATKKQAEQCIQVKPGYRFEKWKGMRLGASEYTEPVTDDMEIKTVHGYLTAVKAFTQTQ